MAEDYERTEDDWIFADADPRALPTERLPGHDELQKYAAPLLRDKEQERSRRRAERRAALGNQETVNLTGLDAQVEELRRERESEAAEGTGVAADDAGAMALDAPEGDTPEPSVPAQPAESMGPDAGMEPTGADAGASLAPSSGEAASPTTPLRVPTYARSGTTPNAETDGPSPVFQLPPRFHDLRVFDAVRDLMALVCLMTALTTTLTLGDTPALVLSARIAIGIGLATLLAVHLLRWIPQTPPLAWIRRLRAIGLAPALLAALAVLVTDLVTGIPVLFKPLPEGPPVGVGVGTSLLLLAAISGMEPRAHEGYLPTALARRRTRLVLVGIGLWGAVMLVLSLVMSLGRIMTTGWAFSLMTLADTAISALLLVTVLGSALLRERSWFVFSAAATGGLVLTALADNSLRLSFAAPLSVATGFVYLPILFAAHGVMVSRSFVRTMPLSFQRADWIVYAVRAFEFSALMHIVAALWNVCAALAAGSGLTPGGLIVHLADAAVCAVFVALSLFSRAALLQRPAEEARTTAVVASVAMIVVGFLTVIVNSVGTGAGAGLVTGALALVTGIAAALMLTVPAPVRDEFGAPDLARMFAEFRTRAQKGDPLLSRIPDVAAARAVRKVFPQR